MWAKYDCEDIILLQRKLKRLILLTVKCAYIIYALKIYFGKLKKKKCSLLAINYIFCYIIIYFISLNILILTKFITIF